MRGGRVSRFSVENFFCHSAENFRSGESFSVSLISGIEKNLLQKLLSRFSIFGPKFLSHSSEKFRS